MTTNNPSDQLDKDLKTIEKAHRHERLHHYQDQPDLVDLYKEHRRERRERWLNVACGIALALAVAVFLGVVGMLLTIKIGLGL